MSRPTYLFVGIGSPHGDDRAGWAVADSLSRDADLIRQVAIRTALVPIDLIDWLDDVAWLHVCDACEPHGNPGMLHHWQWRESPCSDQYTPSVLPAFPMDVCWRTVGTHDLGLAGVLALAQSLGRLPDRVTAWAIEGLRFGANQSMSREVAQSISDVASQVTQRLRKDERNRGPCSLGG